jgi:hypothetical protein
MISCKLFFSFLENDFMLKKVSLLAVFFTVFSFNLNAASDVMADVFGKENAFFRDYNHVQSRDHGQMQNGSWNVVELRDLQKKYDRLDQNFTIGVALIGGLCFLSGFLSGLWRGFLIGKVVETVEKAQELKISKKAKNKALKDQQQSIELSGKELMFAHNDHKPLKKMLDGQAVEITAA